MGGEAGEEERVVSSLVIGINEHDTIPQISRHRRQPARHDLDEKNYFSRLSAEFPNRIYRLSLRLLFLRRPGVADGACRQACTCDSMGPQQRWRETESS